MSKYTNNKREKIKWVSICVAFGLVFIMLIGICMQLFGTGKVQPSNWFKKTETPAAVIEQGSSLIATPEENAKSAMKLTATPIEAPDSSSSYAGYIHACTLIATVSPANADIAGIKNFSWSASWIGSNTDTVTDYIKIDVDTNNPLKSTVTWRSDFTVPINVTCTYDLNPAVKASCRFDCLRRLDNVEVSEIALSNFFNGDFSATITPDSYCDGTVDGTFKVKRFTGCVTDEFFNYVKNTTYYTAWLNSIKNCEMQVWGTTSEEYDSIGCIHDGGNSYTLMCDIEQFVEVDGMTGVSGLQTVSQKSNIDLLRAAFNLAARNTSNNFYFKVVCVLEYNGRVMDEYVYTSTRYSLNPEDLYSPYTAVNSMKLDQNTYVF